MTSGPDLILGVSRAADAAKHRKAVSRLERLSREATGAADAVAQPADPTPAWSAEVRHAGADTTRSARFLSPSSAPDGSQKISDVYVQFEAVLLQNMIEAMMPENAEAMLGSGTAGKIWKSMLAEKLAAEIARTGTLGIAKQIAAGPVASSAAPPSASSGVDDI